MSRLSILITILKYTLGAAATGSVLIAGGLWYFQRHLIYPSNLPSGSQVPRPSQLGMPYEEIWLTTRDRVKLHAFLIPARRQFVSTQELQSLDPEEKRRRMQRDVESWVEEMGKEDAVEYVKSRPTVVIFHANAGNMGHRIPLARKFNVDCRCNVFMLSYRGYGLSDGHASELGIRIDVEAALEYIRTHPLIGNTKLILYGQSIGGAVSLYAAANHPDMISGLILENTFLSLSRLIPTVLPQIPRFLLPILLTEHWDAALTLPRIPARTPVLMLSGLRDQLVPPSHMRELYEIRRRSAPGLGEGGELEEKQTVTGEKASGSGGRVRWREFPLGGHNDTCLIPDYWTEVGLWMKEEVEGEGMHAAEKVATDGAEQVQVQTPARAPAAGEIASGDRSPADHGERSGDESSDNGSWTEVDTTDARSQEASSPRVLPLAT